MIEGIIKAVIGAVVGGALISTAVNTIINSSQNIQDATARTMLALSGTIVAAGFVYLIARTFGLV